ncbi:class I SAM-dependent methyltransferase [Glycomyces albus]
MSPASRERPAVPPSPGRFAPSRPPPADPRRDPEGASGPAGAPTLRLHRPRHFLHRVGTSGLIGFGESYQAGDWDSDDLPGLLTVLAADLDTLVPRPFRALRRPFTGALPERHDNSPRNARRNISDHYDLSNEMFALFLDETMTYSSALFDGDEPSWGRLAEAQRRKIDRLLDGAGVGPDARVLEIGSGWGEAAVRAAERGAHVRTITLSRRQLERVRRLAADRGVADRVDADLRDYRELEPGPRYDAVVSVEMIEAVGERYWPDYFRVLRRSLAPGGRVGLQAITMRHDRMVASARPHLDQQVHLPRRDHPVPESIQRCSREAGLAITAQRRFGADYAATLRLWGPVRLRADRLAELGFDEAFRRTWHFYLAYSQAGFESGRLDVRQCIMEARR